MEIITSKTVDMLTVDNVSILTKKYVELDGVKTQVGENYRCSYVNSESGRALLKENEPENVVSAVFAIWEVEGTESGVIAGVSEEDITNAVMEGVNEA